MKNEGLLKEAVSRFGDEILTVVDDDMVTAAAREALEENSKHPKRNISDLFCISLMTLIEDALPWWERS